MKRCFIDLETSGTDKELHGIIQIAGIVDINNEVSEKFNFNCNLFDHQEYTEDALKVNRYTVAQIESFDSPYYILVALLNVLDKYVDKYDSKDKYSFIGYNCSNFDMPWLRKFFENCSHKFFGSYFWFPSIDVMYMASNFLENKRNKVKNFQLSTVAECLGIEVKQGETHDAMYDIELTRKMYYIMK